MSVNFLTSGLTALLFLLFLTVPAHAYIDPGAGSMLIQVILGLIMGGFFWFRSAIARFIKMLFRK